MAVGVVSNDAYNKFVAFANASGVKGDTIVEDKQGASSMNIVAKSKWDFIGNIGRSAASKAANNDVRFSFKMAVFRMFGASTEMDIPESVRTAMKFEDYGQGKPLTVRRIRAVQAAVEQHVDTLAQSLDAEAAKQNVPMDDSSKALIRTAVMECISKKNEAALDCVKTHIKDIIMNGDSLRSADEVKAMVGSIIAKFELLPQASAKGPYASEEGRMLEACKKFLANPIAAGLGQDAFASMISAVDEGVKTLNLFGQVRGFGTVAKDDLTKKVRDFSQAVDQTLDGCRDIIDQFKKPADKEACRDFIVKLMVFKSHSLERVRVTDDHGEDFTSKEDFSSLKRKLTDDKSSVEKRLRTEADSLKRMKHLMDALSWFCDPVRPATPKAKPKVGRFVTPDQLGTV